MMESRLGSWASRNSMTRLTPPGSWDTLAPIAKCAWKIGSLTQEKSLAEAFFLDNIQQTIQPCNGPRADGKLLQSKVLLGSKCKGHPD